MNTDNHRLDYMKNLKNYLGDWTMSDAISEIEKESEQIRLSKINHSQLISNTKTYYDFYKENFNKFIRFKNDLVKLGYKVEFEEDLKIWKEY